MQDLLVINYLRRCPDVANGLLIDVLHTSVKLQYLILANQGYSNPDVKIFLDALP